MRDSDTVSYPARSFSSTNNTPGKLASRWRPNAELRATAHMGSLGPLPPIDVSMDQKPPKEASRSAESQADLDSELDLLHRELGVKRGVPPRLGYAFVVVVLAVVDLHSARSLPFQPQATRSRRQ